MTLSITLLEEEFFDFFYRLMKELAGSLTLGRFGSKGFVWSAIVVAMRCYFSGE
jgi:hypothetical protein